MYVFKGLLLLKKKCGAKRSLRRNVPVFKSGDSQLVNDGSSLPIRFHQAWLEADFRFVPSHLVHWRRAKCHFDTVILDSTKHDGCSPRKPRTSSNMTRGILSLICFERLSEIGVTDNKRRKKTREMIVKQVWSHWARPRKVPVSHGHHGMII